MELIRQPTFPMEPAASNPSHPNQKPDRLFDASLVLGLNQALTISGDFTSRAKSKRGHRPCGS
jgi:hypothetical protein